jgi:hypothetical protein
MMKLGISLIAVYTAMTASVCWLVGFPEAWKFVAIHIAACLAILKLLRIAEREEKDWFTKEWRDEGMRQLMDSPEIRNALRRKSRLRNWFSDYLLRMAN